MAIYNLVVAASEQRNFEAELPNATAHAIYDGIISARITSVEDQAVDGKYGFRSAQL